MKKLLIVSHTPSDNTQLLTEWVSTGAGTASVELELSQPLKTGPQQVLKADGLVLGTTENFGYMSGALKDFFERSYYRCLDKVAGLPYSLFVKAGNDGTGAVNSVQRIVTGLDLKPIADPLLMVGDFREDWLNGCAEFGMTMAAGLEAGIF